MWVHSRCGDVNGEEDELVGGGDVVVAVVVVVWVVWVVGVRMTLKLMNI